MRFPTSEHYDAPHAKQFLEDMAKAGLEKVRHYEGRNFYKGPAVSVDDLQDALSATKVPCNWDNLGRRYIVYPRVSAILNAAGEEAQKKSFESRDIVRKEIQDKENT